MTHRDTEHGPAPRRAFRGAFASGIGARLAVAAGAAAFLWLCVFWALAR